jgi:hypothetical protein
MAGFDAGAVSEEFAERGYVIVRQVLPPALLLPLRAIMEALLAVGLRAADRDLVQTPLSMFCIVMENHVVKYAKRRLSGSTVRG